MTAPSDASRRQQKPWMKSVRQELDRAMERERRLLASIRKDRLGRLEIQVTNLASTDRLPPHKHAIS